VAPGSFNDVILDLEIVKQEICGIGCIGQDATHLGRRKYHHIGPLLGKPGMGGDGISEVKLRAADFKQLLISSGPQATANRGAGHAAMTGNKNAI
jgi:hypothetical protein